MFISGRDDTLTQRNASIDDQGLTGDVSSALRGKKDDGRSNVIGLAQAPDRHRGRDVIFVSLPDRSFPSGVVASVVSWPYS